MRVLIVDDEYYSRKSLIKMISQYSAGIEVVGEACNGKEVLDMMEELDVDIILTDVRMPIVNGIELSKSIYERYPAIEVIIISGYADFTYAQQAIQYNVRDYLLKPVKKSELFKVLERARTEVQEKKDDKIQKEDMMQFHSQFKQKVFEYEANEFLNKHLPDKDVFLKNKITDYHENMKYQVAILQISQESTLEEKQWVWDRLPLDDNDYLPFYSTKCEKEINIILLHRDENLEEQHRKFSKDFLAVCGDCKSHNIPISIGISEICHASDCKKMVEKEAELAVLNRFLKGWYHIFYYTDSGQENDSYIKRGLDKIFRSSLVEGKQSYCDEFLAMCFQEMEKDTERSSAKIYATIKEIIFICNEAIRNTNFGKDNEAFHLNMQSLHYYRDLSHLYNSMKQYIDMICEYMNRKKQKISGSIVDELIEYMEHNFQNEIQLEELAVNRYYMNSSYLSRLFKKKVGISFSVYLTDVRMKKAKEYLQSMVELNVSDIADLVGYSDLSYFIKTYRDYFGETPGQTKSNLLDK